MAHDFHSLSDPSREVLTLASESGCQPETMADGAALVNELTEITRMVKNADHQKPIVVINTDGFYDGFKMQLEKITGTISFFSFG